LNGEPRRASSAGILSAVYARLATLRRAWYAHPDRCRRLHHRVISVGNLAVGGSGKTPVVAALASQLRDRGERPVILTRGYGRRHAAEGVLVVGDGERVLQPVERSGDEPQWLAQTLSGVPVLVAADRYVAGVFAERHFHPTVSILDDGFQHVQLARDVELLLVSIDDLSDRVVPAGHLREPLHAARFADALLVAGTEEDVTTVATALKHATAFRVDVQYGDVVTNGSVQQKANAADVSSRVVAFAGIARPHRFFTALRALGYDVARELTFPDHHWYSARDGASIQAAAREANASLIVTTAKDAVRCPLQCAVLPITVSIEPAAMFSEWLMGRLAAEPRLNAARSVTVA
jgi:tetraacyldisaccharide 4'-kinase